MGDKVSAVRFGIRRDDVFLVARTVLFAVVLLAIAAWVATGGLRWSVRFHHDEATIFRWFRQVAESGYITDRAYPSGWFELHRLHGCPYSSVRRGNEGIQSSATDDDAGGDGSETAEEGDHAGVRENRRFRFLARHLTQDGAISATKASSFRSMPLDWSCVPLDRGIQDGRDFNAWLYVLSVLFLFLACLESGMRPGTAFLSGLFFCASAAPIEFTHYCETDMGLVFSLALFSWIAARAIRKEYPPLVMVSGFAAGFAMSCKFSLAPLLLWTLLLPAAFAVRRPGSPRRRIALGAALVLGSVLAAFAGYLVGTPALLRAPEWYREALRHASERTYQEILINLGGVRSRWAASIIRASQFVREMPQFGVITLLWGLFAWSFWFRRAFRRYAFGVALLLPVFVPFAIFFFPFIRTQETLPLSFVLALGAGLPLEWWLRRRREEPAPSRGQRLAAAACAALAVLALADGAVRAAGMSSCFRSRDTRAEAQNWLFSSAPRDLRIASDRYVEQVLRGVICTNEFQGGLPYRWSKSLKKKALPPYYIENVGFEGRLPVRNLRTGRLRPEIVRNLESWRKATFELKRWSLPSGISRPTFGQPDIRIVALRYPKRNAVDVPLCLSRPVLILPPGVGLYDSEGAPGLGARRAETIVGKRCAIHVARRDARRWLVAHMLGGEGEATIRCERPFSPTRAKLRRGEVCAVEWKPFCAGPLSWFLSRSEAFPSARVRMRGDDQRQFCIAELVADPVEAAHLLRVGGHPADALALLSGTLKQCPSNESAKVEAFLASRILGREPSPEWESAARLAIDAAHAAEAADGGGKAFAVRGVPARVLHDFSHLRTDPVAFVPGAIMPVYLPPGRYEVLVPLPRNHPEDSVPARVFVNQTDDFSLVEYGEKRVALCCHLDMADGDLLRLGGSASFETFQCNLDISWNPLDQVSRKAREIESLLDK